jgi:predicted flavoprotein YhiN
MFDWDTVTGGDLLQGCFSSAFTAAKAIANPTPKRTLY